MASRNERKDYIDESYYHVYNRGVNKQIVYSDEEDYAVFLNLLKRYLSIKAVKDDKGREYANYYNSIELTCFCLMPNHFHLLLYVKNALDLPKLMSSVCNAYVHYYNKKNDRIGPLFQGRYKASRVDSDEYLLHITRYIHLNPSDYLTWRPSSLDYYLSDKSASWVRPGKITRLFEHRADYVHFLSSFREEDLECISSELANTHIPRPGRGI